MQVYVLSRNHASICFTTPVQSYLSLPLKYCSTTANKLTLKLFPSAVRMIFHQNFTVERLVAWPLNENEAGVDLVFINFTTFLV